MMDIGNVKKFLYSQQVFTALRITLGTLLPGIIFIQVFHQSLAAFSFSLGALCIGLIDTPAPLWRKHRHMLFGTLVIGAISLLTLLALHYQIALWGVLLGVFFFGGLAIAYNVFTTAMGIPAMLAMLMMLEEHNNMGANLWMYLMWIVLGGFWYTYFCLAVCRLFQHQMTKRALAEYLFATSNYLEARSQFYIPEIPLNQCYQKIATAQVDVINAHQAARDVVLTNLFVGRNVITDPKRIRLFNILIDITDMHDSILAMQVDFDSLRKNFSQTDTLDFMRDLLRKITRQLSRVAEVIVLGQPLRHHLNVKAELRALEYELTLQKGEGNVSALQAAYARGRTMSSMMDKLIQDLESTTNTSGIPFEVIEQKYYHPPRRWNPIAWSPAAIRYALRLTIAMALGIIISKNMSGHSIWIVITIMMVLRPGFGLTRLRNKHRLIGSLLGCLAVPALLWGMPQPYLLFWVMAGGFLLSFSFMRSNYSISIFFFTIALLLLYHFMAPGSALIGERILDTLIGTAIGTAAGYLFPSWEYQSLAPQIEAVLRNCRRYARILFATELNSVEYHLARHDALVALTTLSASYQRLLLDPPSKQKHAREIGDLVVHCNKLISEIAALAHTRLAQPEISQTAAFQAAAHTVDSALATTLDKPDEAASLVTSDDLFSVQQSAISILQVATKLKLPGLRRSLKRLRSGSSPRK